MRLILTAACLTVAAPAHAQFSENASAASKQTSMAVGAIGESGFKASSGIVAIPLGGLALASGAVGAAANASGYDQIGEGFNAGATEATEAARAAVAFGNTPLTITEDVVVKPQPAPVVPHTPGQ